MGLYFNLLTQTKFQITLLTPPTSHFKYYLGNAKQLNLLKATSNADHFSESNPPASVNASQMHLAVIPYIQCLKDISKRADLQICETSLWRLIKDTSWAMYLRFPRLFQRRLWVASEAVILGLESKIFFGYLFIYLQAIKYFTKLI